MSKLGSLGTLSGNILGYGAVTIPTPMDLVNFATQGKYGSVTNPTPVVPAACWDKTNFKACQNWAISSAYSDCANLGKAGNWPESELAKCRQDKSNYRMNNNCIATCASGTVSYPGMTGAAAPSVLSTLDLQKLVNAFMGPLGYPRLTEDGVLGKKTCGAVQQFYPDKVPSQCAVIGFTAPSKGGGSSYVAPVTVKPLISNTQTTTTVTTASMLSGTKWIIGSSIAVALGLVGVAIAQKKGWIKK
jgi:hypothetical protein